MGRPDDRHAFQASRYDYSRIRPNGSGVEVNEPWQSEYINGQILSLPPDSISLVPVLFPAGFVHLSVPDWAKFITMQLEGENGGSTLLGADNFKILHTAPFNDGYALGWFVQPYYLWTGGKILSHGATLQLTMPMCGWWFRQRVISQF